MQILFVYLAAVNISAFIAYGADKSKARRNKWRISESALITLAVIGGSLGALAGMIVFRHKIRKWKFRAGIPVILILQIILFWLIARCF